MTPSFSPPDLGQASAPPVSPKTGTSGPAGSPIRYPESFRSALRGMIRGMTAVPLTDSISGNFMIQMIPHHQAAIDIAETLLRYSSDSALRTAASQLVTEQTAGIAGMERILRVCEIGDNSPRSLFLCQNQMNRIISYMFRRMTDLPFTGDIHRDFLCEMIPHHEGAVLMSQNALQYRLCPELVPLLNYSIEAQRRGLCQMRSLLRKYARGSEDIFY